MDPQTKCIDCVHKDKKIWDVFSKIRDYEKYKSDRESSGGFKRVYIHSNLGYIFKLIVPNKVKNAVNGGIISEITFPTYIHLYGNEFLKKRTPRIIEYFAVPYGKGKGLGILEELAVGEELDKYVKQNGPLEIWQAVDIACQGYKYLMYLHQLQIAHLDIKPGNLYYDPDTNLLTFIDFGLACTHNCCQHANADSSYESCKSSIKGTSFYIYPAMFIITNPKTEVMYSYDVYSFTLSVMVSMKHGIKLAQDLNINYTNYRKTSSISGYEQGIVNSVMRWGAHYENKEKKEKMFALTLAYIIIDYNTKQLRIPSPQAEKIYEIIKDDPDKFLESKMTKEIEKLSLKEAPDEFADRKLREIEQSQYSWWNPYGWI